MIHRIVLEIELIQAQEVPQSLGLEHWGEACVEPHRCRPLYRQKGMVTPKALGALMDKFARNALCNLTIIVNHFKGAETEFADMDRLQGIFLPTFPTF
jgi:hypothetical protein